MSDLEGLTRRLMEKGFKDDEIIERLIQEYMDYKDNIDKNLAKKYAMAVLAECKLSNIDHVVDPFIKELLDFNKASVTVGKQGVGCRGAGDFFVHKLIAELAETEQKAFLTPSSLDDAGAIRLKDVKNFKGVSFEGEDLIVVSKMEGIHSRLSDFPFICGFHVTRACLRDLYVKGSKPVSIMIDAHLGDDADVGKLFDFMAGVSAISELTSVPITAGSTLRIGGDMVIGNRFVGGISAIGLAEKRLLARKNIQVGDVILMTEGAGGGTITTTAIYSGNFEVVKETLNIKFLEACEVLFKADYFDKIRAMCDVTNGGLRGDLHEINHEARCGVIINEKKVRKLVNPKVFHLLKKVGVDYLGVSLDALLIYCDKKISDRIISDLAKSNITCAEIGHVDDSREIYLIHENDEKKKILPRFRESAYTKIKQEIGEESPDLVQNMEKNIEQASMKALQKRKKVLDHVINLK
ncbi:MAG: hypothetical protein EU539_03165 [Promethearchaeota archaeon]|nr:MAG: hypothetical protein EU539_03165 [Candidatus Lokiarchaeota archaeon]